jgi:hypothetical protein
MTARPDDFRAAVLRLFAGGVAGAAARCDAASGRFLEPDGGWAVTNQDVIYPLAVLHRTPHAENPHHDSAQLLDLISRGGDALRNAQDGAGTVEFVKVDGSTWGRIYMPWSMFHWMQSWELMRERLDPARARRWEEGLRLAYEGIARDLAAPARIHNIPCWHAMALTRAAQLFGRPEWLAPARAYILRCAEAQSPEGYWPEGGGPTTLYNRVYQHALGLYHHFTGDAAVLPALERALEFHLRFTYPDGADVETIDGRVRYHDRASGLGLPGCLVDARGRRYARLMVSHFRVEKPHMALEPRIAAAFACWRDAEEAAIPQESADFAADHHGKALVRKKGPWFVTLSGYVVPDGFMDECFRGRFRLDRQNCLSVWHERLGAIIAGGNSKFDPHFSSFSLLRGRTRCVQPDAAALRIEGARLVARLAYAGVECELTVDILDDRRVELIFRAGAGASDPVGGFTMRLRHGTTVRGTTLPEGRTVHPKRSFLISSPAPAPAGGCCVEGAGWRLTLPPGAQFSWPHFPYDPYALNYGAPDEAAVACVCAPLARVDAARFRLEVIE